MNFVAWRMLTGDRAKYLGLIFSIAFATFLIAQQASIFAGLMLRTASQIRDVADASLWIMDPRTQYFDEVRGLPDDALYRVRGVPGVAWAVRLFKSVATARAEDGKFRSVILLGLDDATLVGAPRKMLVGTIADLRLPDAVILDKAGYEFFFPGEELRAGKQFELNDHRAVVVGVCEASAPFVTFPVMFTRYSTALGYVGPATRSARLRLRATRAGRRSRRGVPAHHRADRLAGRHGRAVLVDDRALLHEEHGHPGQLRHHHRRGADRGHGGRGADVLHLHHREPQAVRRAQGHRGDQRAAAGHDRAPGCRGRRHRLRAGHRAVRGRSSRRPPTKLRRAASSCSGR